MNQHRRSFLCLGATLVAEALASPLLARAQTLNGPVHAMIVDLNRCTGCGACVVACKLQNHTQPGHFLTEVLDGEVEGGYGARVAFMPILCCQCQDAPCVPVCPVGATYAQSDGTVVTDWDKCIGCGACVQACPYQARFLDTRYSKADKCDFCQHRLAQGLAPACVENCPPRARLFGDLRAPGGEFARLLRAGGLVSRKPELGLRTRVLYKPLS